MLNLQVDPPGCANKAGVPCTTWEVHVGKSAARQAEPAPWDGRFMLERKISDKAGCTLHHTKWRFDVGLSKTGCACTRDGRFMLEKRKRKKASAGKQIKRQQKKSRYCLAPATYQGWPRNRVQRNLLSAAAT